MRLYDSVGPNPHVVRMFMAERGVDIPKVRVNLRGGENRQAEYLARNPAGTLPCLELDDGTVLAETTAICEYLDETSPGSSLIGATPLDRAETRMWTRRIDHKVTEPMSAGFRWGEGIDLFRDRIRCVPHASADMKLIARDGLAWVDQQMAGRSFLCGERMTLADIILFAFVDFAAKVGQQADPALANIAAHHARMAARPSAEA